MPLILLLLGIVTTIAGAILVASGLTVRDGTFAEAITPGTVAVIGGFLLIGMGLAVRELRRIERALVMRPMPLTSGGGDANTSESAEPSVRLPFPTKHKTGLPAADVRSKPVSADEIAAESPVKFPTLPEHAEHSPTAEEESVEVKQSVAASVSRGANWASPARAGPRFDIKPRAASDATRVSGLTTFLSGKSRRDSRPASVHVAAPLPQAAGKPAQAPELEFPAAARPAGTVSVLKSGVVEGMAYTLYSDGSIEAQLPQGTLRFGSITALREHIDSGA